MSIHTDDITKKCRNVCERWITRRGEAVINFIKLVACGMFGNYVKTEQVRSCPRTCVLPCIQEIPV
jgi:hypothetical protein